MRNDGAAHKFALTVGQDTTKINTSLNTGKRRNDNAAADDKYVQRYGYVKGDGHEWSGWPSLYANERNQKHYYSLSPLRERNAYRGGTCSHRRRRFGNFQADQRPRECTELFRGRRQCGTHT